MDFYEIDCHGSLKVESVPTLPIWTSTDKRRPIYVEDVNQLYMGNDSSWEIVLNSNTIFGGDLSGTYDAVVVADNSHSHTIANVTDLQTALNNKLALTGKAADSDLLDGHGSSYFAVAGTLIYAGSIIIWPTEIVPNGYLECNGQSISRSIYSDLFSSIGTRYGSTSSSTFNIPDLRGEFLRGYNHGSGNDPDVATRTDRGDSTTGDNVGTKQTDKFKSHNHDSSASYQHSKEYFQGGPDDCANDGYRTGNTGGNETRPINISVMYCIKY